MRDFSQQTIDRMLLDDLEVLLRQAVQEDTGRIGDLTTMAIVPNDLKGQAAIVAREPGVTAGVDLLPHITLCFQYEIVATAKLKDGDSYSAGQTLAVLHGPTHELLTAERIILNLLSRMCGIATLGSHFVRAVQGTQARVYDTRKTLPGWRRIEKYAAKCGGVCNHRLGLDRAIMIKDNHLACHAVRAGKLLSPAEAVQLARAFVREGKFESESGIVDSIIVEIEVDRIEQLENALDADPDIVLLDNMSCEQLTACVELRNRTKPMVQLEASGGVTLDTIRSIAETGVDRISSGAITHSARNLDLGLDWILDQPQT